MVKIRVDFNRRNGDGHLVTSVRRASGPVVSGDLVVAFQPGEEETESSAEVVSVATDGRLVLALLPQKAYSFEDHIEFWPSSAPLWRSKVSHQVPVSSNFSELVDA